MDMQIGLKSKGSPLLPPKIRAYLYIIRPFTLLPAFIVGFIGAWILHLPYLYDLIFGIMLTAFQAGGQALNQANPVEIAIDRINGKTYRPTVSGILSSTEVTIESYVMIFIGLICGFLLNAILPAMAMGALAVLYSQKPFYLKRYFPLGLIIQAFARGFFPIYTLGYVAHVNTLYLAIFFFIWLIALQSSKDFQDVAGDIKYGIKSLPSMFGVRNAQLIMFTISMFDYGYAIYIGLWHLLAILPLDMLAILLVNRRSKLWENNYAWVSMYTSLGIGTVIGLLAL